MRQLRALVIVGALVLAGQAAAAKSSGTPTSYKVKGGDTLGSIARKYKTTVDALAAANALSNPHKIKAGQTLAIVPPPANTPKMQLASNTKPSPLSTEVIVLGANGVMAYQVAKGDNLSDLAKKFGTTVAELKKMNKLKNSTIRIGQAINVPGMQWTCPVQGAKHHDYSDSWGAPRHGGRLHLGTDVFAKRGTPVVAPVGGKLSHRNGSVGGLAFYLDGVDGVRYYGAHLDSITAKPGNVKAGDVIGTVGDTGNAKGTGPHLHFEIHPKGKAVNPVHTLERWCR